MNFAVLNVWYFLHKDIHILKHTENEFQVFVSRRKVEVCKYNYKEDEITN